MYEKCKWSDGGICVFAGKSLGKIRCGLATGKLELKDNDIELFDCCFKDRGFTGKKEKVYHTKITAGKLKTKSKTTKPKTTKSKITKSKITKNKPNKTKPNKTESFL